MRLREQARSGCPRDDEMVMMKKSFTKLRVVARESINSWAATARNGCFLYVKRDRMYRDVREKMCVVQDLISWYTSYLAVNNALYHLLSQRWHGSALIMFASVSKWSVSCQRETEGKRGEREISQLSFYCRELKRRASRRLALVTLMLLCSKSRILTASFTCSFIKICLST